MIDFACKKFDLDEVIKCSLGLSKSEFKIVKILIKSDKELSSLRIAESSKLDLSSVQRSLKKLNEKSLISRSQKNLSGGGYKYFYSIKNKSLIREKIKGILENWSTRVEEALTKW